MEFQDRATVAGAGSGATSRDGAVAIVVRVIASGGTQVADWSCFARTTSMTLTPCALCTGAIQPYRIPRVVIGEHRTSLGEEELL